MKKLLMLLAALALSVVSLAAPAQATPKPEVSGKPVTVCHATGSASNPYVKLPNVPLVQFLGQNGHEQHEGDIWAPFSYVKRTGSDTWETVNVPGQGDQSLLAFEDCKQPRTDIKIAKPTDTYADECGTKNDVFSVAPGEGYTVNPVRNEGSNQVITVTVNEGYTWTDGSKQELRFVRPAFTDRDCDLPETGGAAYATTAGIGALIGAGVLGLYLLFGGRRRREQV